MDSISTYSRSRRWLAIFCRSGLLVLLLGMGCQKNDDLETVRRLNTKKRQAEATAKLSRESIDAAIAKAETLLQSSQAKAAESALRPLLLAEPEDATLLLLYARCQKELGDYEAALGTASRVKDDNDHVMNEAKWLISNCLAEQHSYHKAVTSLIELLEVKGYQSQVRHRLAAICNTMGHRLQAAEYLHWLAQRQDLSEKEAFGLICLVDPLIDETLQQGSQTLLAQVMQLRADGKYAEALERIKLERMGSASVPPEDSAIFQAFRCRLLAETGDITQLRQALSAVPTTAQQESNYWYAQGVSLAATGDYREAVRCFLEAVTRDPTDSQAYVQLSQNLELAGESDSARVARNRAERTALAIQIARRFGAREGTKDEYLELANLLRDLQRPWEAIAWQRIAFKRYGSSAEQQQRLEADLELAPQQSASEIELAHACGLVRDEWPLNLSRPPEATVTTEPPTNENEDLAMLFDFRDIARTAGIHFQYDNGDDPSDDRHLLHQMTGGGIAVVDYDLDGWPDLYFGQGGGDAFKTDLPKPNQLYRNLHGEQAADVTTASGSDDRGYAQGITAADLNQDGFYDLLIANIGPNAILWNNGDGTFRHEVFPESDQSQWTSSIVSGDLSGDGLPELIELNYVDDLQAQQVTCTPKSDLCNPSAFRAAISRAFQVAPDGSIVPWKDTNYLNESRSYSFAAVVANLDEQAGNDVFIANDADDNAFLVSQPKQGSTSNYSLIEDALIRGCARGLIGQQQGCMGIAAGDFDRNGYLDLHVTNFWNQSSDLYMGQKSGIFQNAAVRLGLQSHTQQTVGWGTQAIDIDNNGWQDLIIMNGHTADHRHRGEPFAMLPQLFRGSANGFTVGKYGQESSLFWNSPTMGRTLATLDWNRDGRMDFVANHLDQPATVMSNETSVANFLQLNLVAIASEREATGTKVVIHCDSGQQTQWCIGGDGFLCTNEPVLQFGLGKATTVDQVQVYWPSGTSQTFANLPANSSYLIVENEDNAFRQD